MKQRGFFCLSRRASWHYTVSGPQLNDTDENLDPVGAILRSTHDGQLDGRAQHGCLLYATVHIFLAPHECRVIQQLCQHYVRELYYDVRRVLDTAG